MSLILGLGTIVGILLPHALRLRHVEPPTAILIWSSALSLRAAAVTLGAAWLLLFFPATQLFEALTHWCWHHLASAALNGHDVGHVTTLLPALLGVASLISVALASLRLARALRAIAVGAPQRGPSDPVIVGGREIFLAVTGLLRPRVLISAGALLELTDAELDAALAHERAHIARRHRYVLAYAELCGAIARLTPGIRTALDELAFHLERDADRWALARRVDRNALAAALQKASGPPLAGRELVLALGGSRVDERLAEILGAPQEPTRRRSIAWRAIAALLVTLLIGVTASVPPVLASGVDVVRSSPAAVDCD